MTKRDRGTSPVVGKVLELGVVALYVGVVSAVLFGGVVPGYRTAVGDRVADRTLAVAADDVEAAIPAPVAAVNRTVAVDLPATIRGDAYRITAGNGTLTLDHPRAGVGGRTRLVVPRNVRVNGTWRSGRQTVVAVHRAASGNVTHVELRTRRGAS